MLLNLQNGFVNDGGKRYIDAGSLLAEAANSNINVGQSLTSNVGGDYRIKLGRSGLTGDNTVMNIGLQNLVNNKGGKIDIDIG